jgi:hypothetical protein
MTPFYNTFAAGRGQLNEPAGPGLVFEILDTAEELGSLIDVILYFVVRPSTVGAGDDGAAGRTTRAVLL